MPQEPLVVRVLPDVPAIDKTFDYLVPDALRDQVRVGDVVRIELHGRRVGGWIVGCMFVVFALLYLITARL